MEQGEGLAKVIAIDGPSGSGKSSIAKGLAERLNIIYIDTGAMYRALAYWAHKEQVPFCEGVEMDKFLGQLDFKYGPSSDNLIEINGHNLTQKIREHHVSTLASEISQIPSVRKFLLRVQKKLGKEKLCVMEGRDIGSVVFPNSFCKFFVSASPEIRAQRRLSQLKSSGGGGEDLSLEKVTEDVMKRDEKDMTREVAPLVCLEDAEYISTDNLSLDQVILELVVKVIAKAKKNNFPIQGE